jgi:hypothetical protein
VPDLGDHDGWSLIGLSTLDGRKGYAFDKPLAHANTANVPPRYSNAVPLPLPLHVVQTGFCKTTGAITCDNRKDRAMCSGCFMEMMEERCGVKSPAAIQ